MNLTPPAPFLAREEGGPLSPSPTGRGGEETYPPLTSIRSVKRPVKFR